MIGLALYLLVPLGVLVLLAYLGWRVHPVPTGSRRFSGWEDAGLVVAFVASQALFGIVTKCQTAEQFLLLVYCGMLVPVLSTVIARSTRPFLMAGLTSAIYAEPLFRLYLRSIVRSEWVGNTVAFGLGYGALFFIMLIFIIPTHHALQTKHSIA